MTSPVAVHSTRELRVEVVSSYTAFLALEPLWNELVEACGVEHPFLEHTWLRTWWECFGAGSELRVLVVREGREPVAIAPLLVSTAQIAGMKVRRLGFFYNSHVPRADFIVPYRAADVHAAIWEHIARYSDWDVVQLCQLTEESPALDKIQQFAQEEGCRSGIWISGASPYIPMSGDWEHYQAGLPAKHRSNLRNRFKRLRQAGSVELETAGTPDGLDDAVADGLKLEAAAWKRDAGTSIDSDLAVSRFYKRLARRAADKGWLRLHFLRAAGRRVAFDYSLEYRNRLYLLKLGYDPEFSPYSPSNLLVAMVLEDAFARGIRKYDFLGESAEWKRNWAKDEAVNRWLFVFSPSLKGWFLHSAKFRLIPGVKAACGGLR